MLAARHEEGAALLTAPDVSHHSRASRLSACAALPVAAIGTSEK
jgi:hypothetical protein